MTEAKPLPTLILTLTPPQFEFDKGREGYRLIRNVENDLPEGATVLRLALVPFLKEDESSVSGNVMTGRSITFDACHGQRLAEFLLSRRPYIPEEWQQFRLLFPGTTWDKIGSHFIPYLSYDDGGWSLKFCRLVDDDDCGPHDRLICFR